VSRTISALRMIPPPLVALLRVGVIPGGRAVREP
jgi:hypothetical protein